MQIDHVHARAQMDAWSRLAWLLALSCLPGRLRNYEQDYKRNWAEASDREGIKLARRRWCKTVAPMSRSSRCPSSQRSHAGGRSNAEPVRAA